MPEPDSTTQWRLERLEETMKKLDDDIDAKASVEDFRELVKRMDRVSASLWALALAIVTSAVTFAIAVTGGT